MVDKLVELINGVLIVVAAVSLIIAIILMAKEEKESGKKAEQEKLALSFLFLTATFFDIFCFIQKEWVMVLSVSIIWVVVFCSFLVVKIQGKNV